MELTIEKHLIRLTKKYPSALKKLLIDHTTKTNIVWKNRNNLDSYKGVYMQTEIKFADLISTDREEIVNGNGKSNTEKLLRKKVSSEVFTPSWICNIQNNAVDDLWFGYKNVFNTPEDRSWGKNRKLFTFPKSKSWKDYVLENRLEITCGEAPYLVSRYDTTTGISIQIDKRIGILDRKIRVINAEINEKNEWVNWVKNAYKSIYGYELQGDNLLIARINMLLSYIEYFEEKFGEEPSTDDVEEISYIISWNIVQMDGLTFKTPLLKYEEQQLSFFEDLNTSKDIKGKNVVIKDWNKNKKHYFKNLIKGDMSYE